MTNETLKKLIQSFVPANENGGQKSIQHTTNVHISAHDHSQIVIGDGQNRSGRNLVFLPATGIFVLILAVCYAFAPISVTMADNISRAVTRVAQCENKHVNKIHAELRAKYEYQNYTRMGMITYYCIMRDLRRRAAVCHPG